jgi:hypothetical protein
MALFGGVFRVAPPITVTEEQQDLALEIKEQALRSSPGTVPLYTDHGISQRLPSIESRL